MRDTVEDCVHRVRETLHLLRSLCEVQAVTEPHNVPFTAEAWSALARVCREASRDLERVRPHLPVDVLHQATTPPRARTRKGDGPKQAPRPRGRARRYEA
jgi:hypothetical protein